MSFILTLAVFAVGLGLYAAAALMFDRRRVLYGWRAARSAEAAETPVPSGRAATLVRAVTALPPSVTILIVLVIGTILMLGSCAGLILW
ncbi:hypothetical protein [Planosporangium mesophilum]|uniref:Uncharacterized protein n=1 Tax=Planosporangium mesophilum TaxID=689768 RepID=A0A8J3TJ36_9ACTN|nr:hypothetical protein [Planosporangium mesophilum]NJC86051.1 hypothetical protein [Planosporangium mesophilum]GII25559.1 hypothetical protein Pme01_51560 [Planosporangium mesophilum]